MTTQPLNSLEPLRFETVQMPIRDLVPYEKNPRKISAAKKKELIDKLEKYGMIGIPVMDYDGTLVSGKQRCLVKVLVGQGDEITDVRKATRKMTEAEFKEVNLIENAKFGEWDTELLQQEFAEFLTDFDFGIDFSALEKEVAQATGPQETPELPVVPKMMEKYQAFVIVCKTDIEATNIGECLGIDRAKSYKSSKIGISNVISAEQFQEAWKTSRS